MPTPRNEAEIVAALAETTARLDASTSATLALVDLIKGDPSDPNNPGLLSGLAEETKARLKADKRRGRQLAGTWAAVVLLVATLSWVGSIAVDEGGTAHRANKTVAQVRSDEKAQAGKNCQTTYNSRLGNREVAQILIDEVGNDFHATADQIKQVTGRVDAVLDARQPLPHC